MEPQARWNARRLSDVSPMSISPLPLKEPSSRAQTCLATTGRSEVLKHARSLQASQQAQEDLVDADLAAEQMVAGLGLWAIHRPQPAVVKLGREGCFKGARVLDIGCGIGDNALYLRQFCGSSVVAIDTSSSALEICRVKEGVRSHAIGKHVAWRHGSILDPLQLAQLPVQQFDVLLDVSTFHSFSNTDRQRYVQNVSSLCKPGGHIYLMVFSDKCADFKATTGQRRLSHADLAECFNTSTGWEVLEVTDTNLEHHPSINQEALAKAGADDDAWRGYAEAYCVKARKLTHGPCISAFTRALAEHVERHDNTNKASLSSHSGYIHSLPGTHSEPSSCTYPLSAQSVLAQVVSPKGADVTLCLANNGQRTSPTARAKVSFN